eukprot:9472932-Pyramimonas_sp.AAC.1
MDAFAFVTSFGAIFARSSDMLSWPGALKHAALARISVISQTPAKLSVSLLMLPSARFLSLLHLLVIRSRCNILAAPWFPKHLLVSPVDDVVAIGSPPPLLIIGQARALRRRLPPNRSIFLAYFHSPRCW